ncbi:MAG: hypothetical protein Q8O67_21080 [Deltaproteobacteria bacterium]|nr:hypothetical protein [Deltaproteobacteria bacterium]
MQTHVVVVLALCAPAAALDVPATIRDFAEAHPDFEDDNGTDRGIVNTQLGDDQKPVYNGGVDGTDTTTGPAEFNQWYNYTTGVNRSRTVFLPLAEDPNGRLVFESDAFFPIDRRGFGNEDNDHNFHFTTEVHPYVGGETFEFDGDDARDVGGRSVGVDIWIPAVREAEAVISGLRAPRKHRAEDLADYDGALVSRSLRQPYGVMPRGL